MSYVGTFGTPATPSKAHEAGERAGHFAQLSRRIIPKPYLKRKSMSACRAASQAIKLLPRRALEKTPRTIGSTGGSLAGFSLYVKQIRQILDIPTN